MGYQPYTRDLRDIEYVAAQQKEADRRRYFRLKRATDIVIATAAITFLLPVLLPIAILIRLTDGGPALFKHKRIGRNGEAFECFKFRSMVTDSQARLERLLESDEAARAEWKATQKLTNDPRITALGAFLRKSSLDELPQLINVLKGEMSIVGPRPITESEIERYGDDFDKYVSVRPGLTGLWQVSGRSGTTYARRVALDVEYVRNGSYSGDIKIMFQTVPAVLMSDGAK
ncbi:MAG: sugar transferase [Henriciella sp.]|nr:sugar transferase [Henriciella sp.]